MTDKIIVRALWVAAACWIMLIGVSAAWNWIQVDRSLMKLAESEVINSFNKDAVYRRWASMHGGVYVPPTETTPPNPYLSHLPDRDIITTDGKQLTLVNPAYMTRQVHELGAEHYGLRGHITSLDPLRPENAPDDWEAEALRAFEAGKSEVMSVELLDGRAYYRFMRPFITEAGCLKCHGHQGYTQGDIRGGISISTPLAAYAKAAGEQRIPLIFAHVLIGVLGLLGFYAGGKIFRQSIQKERENDRRYRSLFDQSLEGIYLHDFEGRIIDVNQKACEQSGYSRDELLQKTVFELHLDKIETINLPKEEILRQWKQWQPGQTYSFEAEHQRKDGSVFPLELSTGIIRYGDRNLILAVVRDITARKHAEAERERLITAIEQGDDVVIITDADGLIQYVNPSFETVTGYSREEVRGQNPRILKSGNQDESFYRDMWDTLTGGNTFHGRMINKRKNGSQYTEDATISPVRDAAGNIVNYVAVKRDVTAHIQMETQLLQAQKMESVGRLAGGVAHDYNNMLSVILGYTEMAMEQVEQSDPLYADLKEVYNAGKRSMDITGQLLAFARKQIINPKVIDLNETLEGMLKMLRRLIGEDINLEWHPKARLWSVKMDSTQVDQILANLCVNARDAISDVGKITIETENITFDAEYCENHLGFKPGDFVMLAVSDNGRGMDKETLNNLFEPFFTTKETGKGTGLGLATVYGIVKQNNGFINVYSEPGQGTTFHIYIPRHAAEETDTAVAEITAEIVPGKGETVLLVEDEPNIIKMGKMMLEKLGYRVLTAETAGRAMGLSAEHAGKIDLLMTDVVMPEMNGRDLAEKLQALNPDLNVLFMSGYTANVIAHHGVLDAGVHFIQKPFSIRDLAAKIRAALE